MTIDTLTELQAARRALVKDRTAALNRAKNLTLAFLKRQNQQILKQIEAHIQAIDQEKAPIVASHPPLRAHLDIFISIPGLGTTDRHARKLGSMDAKHAASLAGLAPVTRQSGQRCGKSLIQGGRASTRQAIYMPALVAIRFNADLKAKYQAMRSAGEPAKVAIIATMRKLIIIANALLRDNRMRAAQKQASG